MLYVVFRISDGVSYIVLCEVGNVCYVLCVVLCVVCQALNLACFVLCGVCVCEYCVMSSVFYAVFCVRCCVFCVVCCGLCVICNVSNTMCSELRVEWCMMFEMCSMLSVVCLVCVVLRVADCVLCVCCLFFVSVRGVQTCCMVNVPGCVCECIINCMYVYVCTMLRFGCCVFCVVSSVLRCV